MSRFLEYIFIYSFVFLFGGESYWLGAVLVAGTFLVVNLVDNATARVHTADMLKIVYGVAMSLAIINILGVLL